MVGYSQSEMDLLLFEKKNEAENKEKPSTSLFSSLKNDKKEDKTTEIDPDANANESWVKSLFKYGKKVISNSDEQLDLVNETESKETETIIEQQKSNAAYFDISNVRLRMTPKEVEEILKKQGYRKISENLEIPNFIEWRSEELCRINGIVV